MTPGETIERAKVSQIDVAVAERNRLDRIRQPMRQLRLFGDRHTSVLDAFEAAHKIAGRKADEVVAAAILTLLRTEEEIAVKAFEAAGYEVDTE